MKQSLFIILFIGVYLRAFAQNIPSERLTDWSLVTTHFEPNFPSTVLNIIDFGGDSSGVAPCHAALVDAISHGQTLGGAVIFFPRGKYFFEQPIQIPSDICLRGESAELTILCFMGGNQHSILIQGTATDMVANLTTTAVRHDSVLWVNDTANFGAGDLVYVVDLDTALVTSDWALGSTGQFAYIESIENQSITLRSPLRRTMEVNLGAHIRKITPARNIFIEQMTLFRLDSTSSQRSTIHLQHATQCQVRCVKSFNANFSHITLQSSCNVQVEGCYFQDAHGYGNGGQGYGVVLQNGASENLVYNNIFKHLRHAMLLQAGPNGNVLAYNYSIEPFWTDVGLPSYSAGDLVLHGNYPYCNLLEGNIVQNIVLDDSHGKNGPYNTFLRNRSELYGIFMNNAPPSNSQHFVSNEITNDSSSFGYYFLNGTDHYVYGNIVKGVVKPAGTTLTTPFSYYLTTPLPYYDTTAVWPPIGIMVYYNSFDIEAKNRFENGQLTVCSPIGISTTYVDFNQAAIKITISPNPTMQAVDIQSELEMESVSAFDITGVNIFDIKNMASSSYQMNTSGWAAGVYVISVRLKDKARPTQLKLIKF